MENGFFGGGASKDKRQLLSEQALTRLEKLKAQLSDAQSELRRKRALRLEVEKQGPVAEVPLRPLATPDTLSVDQKAIEALASHPDPPPDALHRLAQALMMLQESQGLVDLGEHPLPGQTSWKNLQTLLGKSIEPFPAPVEIAAILSKRPFGPRLADHVRNEVLGFGGGQALTRHKVCQADDRCSGLFDFVTLLLRSSAAVQQSHEPAEGDAREKAIEAVERHEQEVALLRRRLKEVERQEAVATAFASKHGKATAAAVAKSAEAGSQEDLEKDRQADRSLSVDTEEQLLCAAVTEEQRDPLGSKVDEKPPLSPAKEDWDSSDYIATHNTSIQYRLNETDVPQLQISVLEMLARLLLQEEKGSRASVAAEQRRLELQGCCDGREDLTIASLREAAVREWLHRRGVPKARVIAIKPSVPADGLGDGAANWKRGSRTVELRLFERQPSADSTRRRAVDLLNHLGVGVESAAAQEPAPRAFVGEAPAAISVDAPTATCEELCDKGAGRRLRVVFSKPGLSGQDTNLEVAANSLRLSSLSASWASVEVPLAFQVLEARPGAAKFSRKAGTLTVTLGEAQTVSPV